MSEIEILEVQIKDLENAYNNIVEAMNNLKDVDGLDETYRSLDLALYDIDDKKAELKVELDELEEQAYMQENEQQWKKEQRDQEYQYWQSQF